MLVKFKTKSDAMDFMSFLMSQNNQGYRQILYEQIGLAGVEYSYYNVIHDDVYDKVDTYLSVNK